MTLWAMSSQVMKRVYQYDPETNRQNAQWKTANSPRQQKILLVQIKMQNNVADFF